MTSSVSLVFKTLQRGSVREITRCRHAALDRVLHRPTETYAGDPEHCRMPHDGWLSRRPRRFQCLGLEPGTPLVSEERSEADPAVAPKHYLSACFGSAPCLRALRYMRGAWRECMWLLMEPRARHALHMTSSRYRSAAGSWVGGSSDSLFGSGRFWSVWERDFDWDCACRVPPRD